MKNVMVLYLLIAHCLQFLAMQSEHNHNKNLIVKVYNQTGEKCHADLSTKTIMNSENGMMCISQALKFSEFMKKKKFIVSQESAVSCIEIDHLRFKKYNSNQKADAIGNITLYTAGDYCVLHSVFNLCDKRTTILDNDRLARLKFIKVILEGEKLEKSSVSFESNE